MSVRVTGLRQTAQRLGQVPEALRASAVAAMTVATGKVRGEAIRLFAERVNLSEDTLGSFIEVGQTSVRADGVRGSVTLKVKAVPLTAFGAQVQMLPYTGPDSRGRRYKSRVLPQVRVALYRDQRPRILPGAFALRQRNNGPLNTSDRVVRRVGQGVGDRRDGSSGRKLAGFRFFTFPKRTTNQVLPALKAFAGEQFAVDLRVAYRKQLRGVRVLRGNRS